MKRPNGLSLSVMTCENGATKDGPGIAELDAPAGAYPRSTGGPAMLTHPHPPRPEASR